MDILTTLSSVKTAIDLAKDIKNTQSLIDNADVKLQVIELIDTLVDTKADLADIKTQLLEKDKLIAELKEQLNKKKSVFYEEPYYWIDLDDGKIDGAFCQKCYDGNNKLARVVPRSHQFLDGYYCHVCDTWFYKDPKTIKPLKD